MNARVRSQSADMAVLGLHHASGAAPTPSPHAPAPASIELQAGRRQLAPAGLAPEAILRTAALALPDPNGIILDSLPRRTVGGDNRSERNAQHTTDARSAQRTND